MKNRELSGWYDNFLVSLHGMQVLSPHSQADGYISDHCDGGLFRSIALFRDDPCSLQLILYFDEVEICNPLGAQRGIHKIGRYITACVVHWWCIYPFVIVFNYHYYRTVLLHPWKYPP